MIFDITEKDVFAMKLKGVPVRVTALIAGEAGSYRFSKSFEALIRSNVIRYAPFAPDSFVYEVMYPLRVLSVMPLGHNDHSFMHGQRFEIGDVIRVKDAAWDSK